MKIAITDACIFIDIIELGLAKTFFGLPIEIHTTLDVFNEMNSEQKAVLHSFIESSTLTVHILSGTDFEAIITISFPRSLSNVDKTVLYLATKLDAMVLSSDKVVRNFSKGRAIEYHGILWILDQLIEAGLITKHLAANKLRELISINIMYQNNTQLMSEIFGRIDRWSK